MTSRATALAFILALAVAPLPAQEPPTGDRAVYRVPVTGVIELGLAPFIERSLREAEGAVAVILDIDTPGGRVDAAERIVDAVSDATVPVYAYVNRRAFSAGAMIALSSREIHMRPGAVLGAATPVGGTGEKAPEKIVSAMRSTMRALAEARGLDPRVAEAMVDEDIAIPDVTEAGKLLTLTTAEAVQLGYARAVDDWDTLMLSIGATGAPVHETEVNWAERLVRFLTHPVVAPLLLSLGFFGVIIELRAPGLGLPGAVGVLALALFFGSHLLIGLAGLEAVLLFAAGVVLIGIEVFVIPGREGIAVTDLRPSGTGLFGEERIDVVSESQWVERGSPIRIIASEGYRQVVRLVGAAEGS